MMCFAIGIGADEIDTFTQEYIHERYEMGQRLGQCG